ncbi:hypothetical protein CC86DRAFT_379662 [Ophiobolus disseminans]|uniref:Uncharacterized protein n=1 Tax=Ophiobolus disseminans TaxID=1469910 RepID=A0A6A7ABY8_9PLEO|nr:hypothetical protein CC86DRAFT_379662 [Ophiobolus disseminans]
MSGPGSILRSSNSSTAHSSNSHISFEIPYRSEALSPTHPVASQDSKTIAAVDCAEESRIMWQYLHRDVADAGHRVKGCLRKVAVQVGGRKGRGTSDVREARLTVTS